MEATSKIIIVPSNSRKIYAQYLTFMNPFFNLTNNEIRLIGEVMYYYKQSEGAKEEIRWDWVFSTETRKKIKTSLKMNDNTFNTTLNKLRNKKLIDGNKIDDRLVIDPSKEFDVVIKFKLKDETKSEKSNRGSSKRTEPTDTGSVEDLEKPIQVYTPEVEREHSFE